MILSSLNKHATPALTPQHAALQLLSTTITSINGTLHDVAIAHVQDACFILTLEKYAIVSAKTPSSFKCLLEQQGLTLLEVTCHFDGGNLIRVANTIFHGHQPIGHYAKGLGDDMQHEPSAFTEELDKLFRQVTTLRHLTIAPWNLNSHFAQADRFIRSSPIRENGNYLLKLTPLLEHTLGPYIIALAKHYYHIDCYASISGNSLFILNQAMLAEETRHQLMRLCDDHKINLIDLAWRYVDKPIMLNLLHLTTPAGKHTISMTDLPTPIAEALSKHADCGLLLSPEIAAKRQTLEAQPRVYHDKEHGIVEHHQEPIKPLLELSQAFFRPNQEDTIRRIIDNSPLLTLIFLKHDAQERVDDIVEKTNEWQTFYLKLCHIIIKENPLILHYKIEPDHISVVIKHKSLTFSAGKGGPHCLLLTLPNQQARFSCQHFNSPESPTLFRPKPANEKNRFYHEISAMAKSHH